MKKLITLLLVLGTLNIYSQNEVVVNHKYVNFPEIENIVFDLINKERIKHGLNEVQRDKIVDEVAFHQSFYLSHDNISLRHEQDLDIENWEEIEDLQDRVHHFMGNKHYGGEIILSFSGYDSYQISGNLYTQHWADSTLESLTNHISHKIFNQWMGSPGHKDVILNKTFTFNSIGVSIVKGIIPYREESASGKIITGEYTKHVAVVVFTN